LIGPENIYLINVGDSRAIIISNDGKVLAFTRGLFFFYLFLK
jgi:serine/threonine protein phosphatase PrpC